MCGDCRQHFWGERSHLWQVAGGSQFRRGCVQDTWRPNHHVQCPEDSRQASIPCPCPLSLRPLPKPPPPTSPSLTAVSALPLHHLSTMELIPHCLTSQREAMPSILSLVMMMLESQNDVESICDFETAFSSASPSAPPPPCIIPPAPFPHIAFTPVVVASAHKYLLWCHHTAQATRAEAFSDAEVFAVTSRLSRDIGSIYDYTVQGAQC